MSGYWEAAPIIVSKLPSKEANNYHNSIKQAVRSSGGRAKADTNSVINCNDRRF
jgi:hypothetical protein